MPADLGLPDWEASWPQRRERRPRFVDPYYLHYSALVASLAAARDRYVTAPARILDIGCGEMPYYPLFAPVAAEYVGTDIEPGPNVTHVCPVEALEIDDASFDVVLCTQVLEHSRDPAQALREIARVLKPGGYVFATTHGIWPFHPYPVDLWRWTQQGLEALVADTAGLALQDVVPHRGSASTVALMIGYYVDIVTRRRFLAPVRWATISALNVAGLAGDRVRRLGYPNNDTLIHNFLVVGRREGEPG